MKCLSVRFPLTFSGTVWSRPAAGSERSLVQVEGEEYAPRGYTTSFLLSER